MNADEQYFIRERIFKILGAAFHIYSENGNVVGYCKQKAFRLKEDLRIYSSESCSDEIMLIKARNIVDFGATYAVTLPTGAPSAVMSKKTKGKSRGCLL